MSLDEQVAKVRDSGTPEQQYAYIVGNSGQFSALVDSSVLEIFKLGIDNYLRAKGFEGIVAAEDFVRGSNRENISLQKGFAYEFRGLDRVTNPTSTFDSLETDLAAMAETIQESSDFSFSRGALMAYDAHFIYLCQKYGLAHCNPELLNLLDQHREVIRTELANIRETLETPETYMLRDTLAHAVEEGDYARAERIEEKLAMTAPAPRESYCTAPEPDYMSTLLQLWQLDEESERFHYPTSYEIRRTIREDCSRGELDKAALHADQLAFKYTHIADLLHRNPGNYSQHDRSFSDAVIAEHTQSSSSHSLRQDLLDAMLRKDIPAIDSIIHMIDDQLTMA